jgi:hypothetical protein
VSNPNTAIEKEYGLPAGSLSKLSIKVVEEPGGTVVVPIPPNRSNIQLTDEQLEAVAGGFAFTATVTAAVSIGVATAGAGYAVGSAGKSRGW